MDSLSAIFGNYKGKERRKKEGKEKSEGCKEVRKDERK